VPKSKPAKPATVTDIALRLFIQDLVDRGQVPVMYKFARELGFNTSHQVKWFLEGERNFPIAKVHEAIDVLVKTYKANRNFLLTGHGQMYKGKAYMMEDQNLSLQVNENILSYGGMKKVNDLEKVNEELKQRIRELERIEKQNRQLIETQQDLIMQLKTRTKKRT
jgi:hypothetical protein